MKELKEKIKKILVFFVRGVKKFVLFVRVFFAWIIKKAKEHIEKLFIKMEEKYDKYCKGEGIKGRKELILAETFVVLLFVSNIFVFNIVIKIENIIIYIAQVIVYVLLLLMMFLFWLDYKKKVWGQNKYYKRIYCILLILFFIVIIPLLLFCSIPLVILNFIRKKEKDEEKHPKINIILRVVAILVFLIMFIFPSMIRAFEMSGMTNIMDYFYAVAFKKVENVVVVFLVIMSIFFFIPFWTCKVLYIYKSIKEALKEQSVIMIGTIVIIKLFCFVRGIKVSHDIKTISDIASWMFAFLGFVLQ